MSFSKELNNDNLPPGGVTLKNDPNYVDLLDEDKPISGQKLACMSFISPEHIIKQKEMFYFEEFLKQWEFNKSMEKNLQFLILSIFSITDKKVFDGILLDGSEPPIPRRIFS